MRTGAFDVSFGNVKVKHMSTQLKRFVTRDDAATAKRQQPEEPPPVPAPTAQPLAPATAPQLSEGRLAEGCARVCVPATCCALVVYSVSTTLPYMDTLVNIIALEMTPVAVLFQDTSQSHIAYCIALLAMGACASLFVCSDSMRQPFMGYPTYVSLVLVLALLAVSPGPAAHDASQTARLRAVDLLLVVFTYMAVFSALLMRHMLAHQPRVVQATEFVLLVLCACTYSFLVYRYGASVAS